MLKFIHLFDFWFSSPEQKHPQHRTVVVCFIYYSNFTCVVEPERGSKIFVDEYKKKKQKKNTVLRKSIDIQSSILD